MGSDHNSRPVKIETPHQSRGGPLFLPAGRIRPICNGKPERAPRFGGRPFLLCWRCSWHRPGHRSHFSSLERSCFPSRLKLSSCHPSRYHSSFMAAYRDFFRYQAAILGEPSQAYYWRVRFWLVGTHLQRGIVMEQLLIIAGGVFLGLIAFTICCHVCGGG